MFLDLSQIVGMVVVISSVSMLAGLLVGCLCRVSKASSSPCEDCAIAVDPEADRTHCFHCARMEARL
ncbi:hypothetical protein [uncultured Anaeromusa sp.]|uniref:hypothetical protein n=1 Tax=uncultured Anaeromusa sp. TaxID=673273 RepID=UPI0029C88F5A|nr:hypothetical protein [uncultured Anaeromusa sp.]